MFIILQSYAWSNVSSRVCAWNLTELSKGWPKSRNAGSMETLKHGGNPDATPKEKPGTKAFCFSEKYVHNHAWAKYYCVRNNFLHRHLQLLSWHWKDHRTNFISLYSVYCFRSIPIKALHTTFRESVEKSCKAVKEHGRECSWKGKRWWTQHKRHVNGIHVAVANGVWIFRRQFQRRFRMLSSRQRYRMSLYH